MTQREPDTIDRRPLTRREAIWLGLKSSLAITALVGCTPNRTPANPSPRAQDAPGSAKIDAEPTGEYAEEMKMYIDLARNATDEEIQAFVMEEILKPSTVEITPKDYIGQYTSDQLPFSEPLDNKGLTELLPGIDKIPVLNDGKEHSIADLYRGLVIVLDPRGLSHKEIINEKAKDPFDVEEQSALPRIAAIVVANAQMNAVGDAETGLFGNLPLPKEVIDKATNIDDLVTYYMRRQIAEAAARTQDPQAAVKVIKQLQDPRYEEDLKGWIQNITDTNPTGKAEDAVYFNIRIVPTSPMLITNQGVDIQDHAGKLSLIQQLREHYRDIDGSYGDASSMDRLDITAYLVEGGKGLMKFAVAYNPTFHRQKKELNIKSAIEKPIQSGIDTP